MPPFQQLAQSPEFWQALLIAVIASGGCTQVITWLLRRIDQAGKPDPALSKRLDQVDASLSQLDQRLDPLQDGVKTLLLCKLEQMQREMVDAGGIADNDLKTRAEGVYSTYHALGGNGHGTQVNQDIQNAPIKPKQ